MLAKLRFTALVLAVTGLLAAPAVPLSAQGGGPSHFRAKDLFDIGGGMMVPGAAALTRTQQGISFRVHTSILAAALCGGLAAQTPDASLISLINQHHRAARQLDDEGKFREAGSKYHEALQAAQRLGPVNPWVARIHDDLGSIYQVLHEDLKAERHYLRAIQTWKQVAGDSAKDLAFPLNSLGLLYVSQGRPGKAEPLFLRALEIHKSHSGPEHLDVGGPLQNLAFLRLSQRRFDEAREYLRQAEVIIARDPRARGEDHAALLHNLALLELDLARPEKAISYLERAVAELEWQFGPETPFLIPPLGDLATAYLRLGDTKRSESVIERALALAEAALEADHPAYAAIFETKAQLLRKTGRKSEARQLAKQAKQIRAARASGDPRRHTVDINSLRSGGSTPR